MYTQDKTEAMASIVEQLKLLPEFKRTKYHDLVKMVEGKSKEVNPSYFVKLAHAEKQPFMQDVELLSKAAVSTITNDTVNTQDVVNTPSNVAYSTVKSDVVFTALETIPVTSSTTNMIKVKSNDEAEVITNEGDAMVMKGGVWEAQSIKMANVAYVTSMSNQMLDDNTAVQLYLSMINAKVRKLAATKVLGSFKGMKEALTVTGTDLLDKVSEALYAMPDEIEARLIVVNKADAVKLDKALLAAGQPSIKESNSLLGVPCLVNDSADTDELLIITNSAVVFYEPLGAFQYGTNADDFTKNVTSCKLRQRVEAGALTDGAVYAVSLA
ncbi:phage major capsid protein [Vibrio alginolyticus]